MGANAQSQARRGRRGAGLLLTAAAALAAGPAAAADPPLKPEAPPVSASGWDYQLSLYGWATSLKGDVGVRNLPTTAIDVPFTDVLQRLDGALMGSFFANNGQWMVLADVVFAKLSDRRPLTSVLAGSEAGAEVTQTILTGAVGYMLPTGRPDVDFAVTAGVRYMSVKGSLKLNPLGPLPGFGVSQRQAWADPTVGFFAHWELNEKWFLNAVADIGGFTVGSDLSSSGYLGVGYKWSQSFSTSIGYRYLHEDYEAVGARAGAFRYKTTMHGPTMALAWYF